MWGAIIGAGASLIGGALSRKDQRSAQDRTDKYNDPKAIRKRYEAAGFNPIIGIENASPLQQPSGWQPTMGSAIANAGLALQSGLQDKQALEIEASRLAMEKERLEKLLTKETIRPDVGGMYAGREQMPAVRESVVKGPGMTFGHPISSDTGPLIYEDELQRYDVPTGGAPGEAHIYHRNLPGGIPYYSERPGMGQRVEDESGELLAAPMMLPYVISDAYHNSRGEIYDPKAQQWKRGSGLRTLLYNPIDYQGIWEQTLKRQDKKRKERADPKTKDAAMKAHRELTRLPHIRN